MRAVRNYLFDLFTGKIGVIAGLMCFNPQLAQGVRLKSRITLITVLYWLHSMSPMGKVRTEQPESSHSWPPFVQGLFWTEALEQGMFSATDQQA